MNIRSVLFTSAVVGSVAVGACSDHHNPPIAPSGSGPTPDGPTRVDAREPLDAPPHVFEDAHVYLDAHIYNDAAIARACVNVSAPPPFEGKEELVLGITCQDLSETGTVTHAMLHGVMSSNDAGTVIVTTTMFTLDCGHVYGVPANNFLPLTTNDTLTATSIASTSFDVNCN